jgi:hypothetical protein
VEIRTQIAALCSMIAIAALAGAYVYQDAVLPVAEAFSVSAAAGLFGAVLGWVLTGVLRWAPAGTAQHTSMPKPSRAATAAR